MKYKLYRPKDLSTEQWQIYAALRDARAIYDDPFFDPDFARLVGEVREDTRIGFASDRNGVFAVWPMHIRPGNWARPIGAPFSDWNGPILSADTALSAQEILAGFEVSGFTTQGFMPGSVAKTNDLKRVGANISDLSAGWDKYISIQQAHWPKHFKKMRRIYRKIERDLGDFTFVWRDTSDAAFETTLKWKREQFARTGYFDVLNAAWTRDLLDRLRGFEGPRLKARLSTLSFGDSLGAAEFNLQSDTILHGWITSFDQNYRSYSPGNILLQQLLEAMPQEGLTSYDAGPGHDHYKRHYANQQMPIESGVIIGDTQSLRPARLAGKVWRFGEQVMPGKASSIMARARRRMDQIAAVDTTLSGRANGFVNALQNRPV